MGSNNTCLSFEFSPMLVGIITLLVLLGIMFLSAQNFGPGLADSKKTVYEEPLIKSRQLSLLPGERYRYDYRMGNESIAELTFWVLEGPSRACTVLSLGGKTDDSFICIDKWGVEKDGNNITYSNPYVVMFKPWMLAVGEGWKWNASVGLQIGKLRSQVFEVNLSTIAKGTYRGREAWLIHMGTSDSNSTTYFWVDEKKRVLLLENGTGYEIELIDGIKLADNIQD